VPEYGYQGIEEEEIDLLELFQTFWRERILIAKITGIFVVLGLLIAIFSPVEYSTEATLMPEAQSTQSSAGSLLQKYGGLLGINGGGAMEQEGTIPPQLYPNIVQSLPFQVELMNTKVHFSRYDTTTTVYQFYENIYSPSIFSYLVKYTVGLPGKVVGLFREEQPEKPLPASVNRDTVLSLTKDQMDVVKTLRDQLTVTVDQETGIITVKGEFPDPQASAAISHAGIMLLKKYMGDYRTNKATEDLEFVKQQVTDAKERFKNAQDRLADFRDSNINLTTAKAQTKEQQLQSQYDLSFNLYNSLSQQLEQARLQVQQNTPVFTILQPVNVPIEKSAPKRILILLISVILGCLAGFGWVLVKEWWINRQIDNEF